MVFIYNFDPVFLHLGPVQIRYYGLVYVVGFLLVYFLLRHLVKQGRIRNMHMHDVDDYVLWLIIGVIVFARIFAYVFFYWNGFVEDLLGIFRIWEGGMSFHGALMGATLATLWFCKRKKISFYQLADLLVLPAALMLFFGRIANFVNGELWGTISNVPWCVQFPGVDGCRHPSQLYEAVYSIVLFFILYLFYRSREAGKKTVVTERSSWQRLVQRPGFIFWSFWFIYGIFRFVENFWRDDARWLGLSLGQYFCIVMVVVGAVMLWRLARNTLVVTH